MYKVPEDVSYSRLLKTKWFSATQHDTHDRSPSHSLRICKSFLSSPCWRSLSCCIRTLHTMADAFGGSRNKVKPPERGVFALDHAAECKVDMKAYLACLRDNKQDHFPCKEFSRKYLQCRMDKDLMAEEPLDNLGLGDSKKYIRVQPKKDLGTHKESKGFVAGTGVAPSGGSWGIGWTVLGSGKGGKGKDKDKDKQ